MPTNFNNCFKGGEREIQLILEGLCVCVCAQNYIFTTLACLRE